MKFGGTSVAGNEAISRTIDIIGSKIEKQPVVVVSAMSGVTDLLYLIADKAAAKAEQKARKQAQQNGTKKLPQGE